MGGIISLFVDLKSSPDLQPIFEALSDAGEVLMPPGDYGFSTEFAWLNDGFGVP